MIGENRVTASEITAVVLAGGQGTRIRHLLPELPKPMAPVRGRPFLGWIVRYLQKQGIRRIIISTGYRAIRVESYFAKSPLPEMTITCVAEPTPLGTAGGFLQAIAGAETPGAWLVCNGDSLVLTDLAPLFHALDDQSHAGALLAISAGDTSRFGRLEVGSSGALLGFAEKKPGAGLINAGVYLLRPSLLAKFPAQRPLSFETDVFPELLKSSTSMQVVTTTGAPFLDIGAPETLAQAEQFIAENNAHFSDETCASSPGS